MNQNTHGDVGAPSRFTQSSPEARGAQMGSIRADQPGSLSSGQEEGSPITLALLPVTQLGPQDKKEPTAWEGPARFSQHTELAGTDAGPDL